MDIFLNQGRSSFQKQVFWGNMFVSGQQYGAKGRAASMREAVYVLSTAVPPDPVAPWGGSCSHIGALFTYCAM